MDTEALLKKRIALTTPEDTMVGLAIEGAMDFLKTMIPAPRLLAMRQEITGVTSYKSFFRYPMSHLLNMMLAAQKEPGISLDCHTLMHSCGRHALRVFLDSPVGRAVTTIGRGKPMSLVSSVPMSYKPVVSFGTRIFEKTGENSANVIFKRELFGPSWSLGIFNEGYASISGIKGTAEVHDINDSGTDFVIESIW